MLPKIGRALLRAMLTAALIAVPIALVVIDAPLVVVVLASGVAAFLLNVLRRPVPGQRRRS
jgi:hypothetical protein